MFPSIAQVAGRFRLKEHLICGKMICIHIIGAQPVEVNSFFLPA
jgi:hypothetical protein